MPRLDDRRVRNVLERVAPGQRKASLHVILPEHLTHNPWVDPVATDRESMDRLAGEVRSYGVREPLLARRLPDGGYQVLMGRNRLEVARRIGLRTLPVIVAELSDADAMAIALVDGIGPGHHSAWDNAERLAALTANLRERGQNASRERLALLVDHSPAWIDRMLFIAERLSPAVLEEAGVAIHDMHGLSEDELQRAARPDDVRERARALHSGGTEQR